ncbi:hypothetical protein B0181_05040 [Moraxella caviae]|uniref:Uncharacterized protein n=1 Tax=Moraxella caviae TaxID=34060 RepID=A0A1T0A3F1_9GAMM|nr:hypothetical protein [Moraxella caviae]OOR90240.1 hypothetical protein B0181_05040 [Moraxella caviae]STZ14539.1 Uncharacterised protein [Moraxella caviae]VEW12544.1 Uncharacterised protein [Moraxella caviae]
MIPLDLPAQDVQIILQNAQTQGLSIESYIMNLVHKDNPVSLLDVVADLPEPTEQHDGLAIQQSLRSEWN